MDYPDKEGFVLEVGSGRPERIRRSNTDQRPLIPLTGAANTRSVCLVSKLVNAKLCRYICVRGHANDRYRRRGDEGLRRCDGGCGCLSHRTLDWSPRGRYTLGTSKCLCGSCLRQLFAGVLPIRLLWLRSPLCKLLRKMHVAHTERKRTCIGT